MTMSRTTKSVAAVGVGVLLLTAAGGTFARWSVSEPVDGGTITAGHLDMDVSDGIWYDMKTDSEIVADDFMIVPGDILEYRATITPALVGDNLVAELTTNLGNATGELKEYLEPIDATLDGQVDLELTPTNTAGQTINAVVRVEMIYGEGTITATAGGADKAIDLSTLEISLVQKNPNP